MAESTSSLAESTEKLEHQDGDESDHEDQEEANVEGEQESVEQEATEDPTVNLGILHPLEYEWTTWYDKRPATQKRIRGEQEQYESNLRPVGTFGTVEDFWRYYNHLVKPSKMENNSNYHLFKKGVKPMWEDPANAKGGKWVLVVKGPDKGITDLLWENIVLALIGETLDIENEICGAVMSRRKQGDRIAVWNKDRDNETAVLTMGRKLKALLGVDPSRVQISYQSHEDSMRSGASYSNPAQYKL